MHEVATWFSAVGEGCSRPIWGGGIIYKAGRMMTSLKIATDAGFVEVLLSLHGNLDIIPPDAPELWHQDPGRP